MQPSLDRSTCDLDVGRGFHRVAAAEREGQPPIAATVHRGTQRDALLHAVGADDKPGLPRSRAGASRGTRRVRTRTGPGQRAETRADAISSD